MLAPELLACLLPDEEIHRVSGASASQLFSHFKVRPVAKNTLNHQNLVRILQLLLPSNCRVIGLQSEQQLHS